MGSSKKAGVSWDLQWRIKRVVDWFRHTLYRTWIGIFAREEQKNLRIFQNFTTVTTSLWQGKWFVCIPLLFSNCDAKWLPTIHANSHQPWSRISNWIISGSARMIFRFFLHHSCHETSIRVGKVGCFDLFLWCDWLNDLSGFWTHIVRKWASRIWTIWISTLLFRCWLRHFREYDRRVQNSPKMDRTHTASTRRCGELWRRLFEWSV